jgi:hypothetical protein
MPEESVLKEVNRVKETGAIESAYSSVVVRACLYSCFFAGQRFKPPSMTLPITLS